MTTVPTISREFLKTAMWTILWSTVLTVFIASVIRANNDCLLVINGAGWMWTIVVLVWLWLLAFLSFRNHGRSIIVVCTLFIFAFYGNADRVPIAAAEARAVGHLRRLSQMAREYRREHPAEGFPENLPTVGNGVDAQSTVRLYKIVYKSSRSNIGRPADKFLIQAIPLRRDCGYIRSFAAAEDGNLYSTVEARPANASDTPLQ